MNFEDSTEEAAYRAKARTWLADNAAMLVGGERDTPAEALTRAKAWQARKADAGYACITWGAEWGGGGGSAIDAVIFGMEEEAYQVKADYFSIGLGMCVPTVIEHGDDAMRQRFVGPAVRGEEIWCQLFSEPGAGSDLAGLRTRAVRDGDGWVVDGQKVWTSGAHRSDFGILLVRTDPDAPKHQGLTMFWVDMASPGIDVRPIHQMSGEREFNEVFFTGVHIPDTQRLGPIDGGWKVAVYTLMNERLAVGRPRGVQPADIMALARDIDGDDGPMIADPAFRQTLARWHVQSAGIRNTRLRAMTALSRGDTPGPESSISKLIVANMMQELGAAASEMAEQYGVVVPPGNGDHRMSFPWALLFSPGFRIAGGTDEILKNIIAERVLGLPGDIRTDKGVAFKDLVRGA